LLRSIKPCGAAVSLLAKNNLLPLRIKYLRAIKHSTQRVTFPPFIPPSRAPNRRAYLLRQPLTHMDCLVSHPSHCGPLVSRRWPVTVSWKGGRILAVAMAVSAAREATTKEWEMRCNPATHSRRTSRELGRRGRWGLQEGGLGW